VSRVSATSPRLLYVANASYYFISHRLPLAEAAQRDGWDVHVAVPGSERNIELERRGLRVHEIRLSRWGVNPLIELRSIAALHSLYRRLRPSLVHHVAVKPVLYGGMAARAAGVPGVVHAVPGLGQVFASRDVRSVALRRVVSRLYRIALHHPNQRVIFQNAADRSRFVEAGYVRPDHARLIRGSGVDVGRFTPAAFPTGRPTVVLASRLLWHKGVGDLVEAASILRSAGVNVRVALVGRPESGNPASIPEATLESWTRTGDVEWWGFQVDMPSVFARAHVVCLPSYYGEGVPKVLLEAAACGRPLVASDIPGCHDIVRDGDNGFLVPPRRPHELARTLGKLLGDGALQGRLGSASRRIVVEEFALDRVVRETLDLYTELSSLGRAPRLCRVPEAST
jgi:glycosyltransferase involved in cell wall biosynthesis